MIIDFDYADILVELSDSYRETGRLEEALILVDQARQVYQMLEDYHYIECIERTGAIQKQLGNLEVALNYYKESSQLQIERFKLYKKHKLYKEHVQYMSDRGYVDEIASSFVNLAELYTALGDYQEAEGSVKELKKRITALRKEIPWSHTINDALAHYYARVGEIHDARGENIKAFKAYHWEKKLFGELHTAFPLDVEYKYGLALSTSKIGGAKMFYNKYRDATLFFIDCNNLMLELCKEYPSNVMYKNLLAISYMDLGGAHLADNSHEKSYQYFKYSVFEYEKLTKMSEGNAELKNGLATSYIKIGEALNSMERNDEAVYFYRKAIAVMKELSGSYSLYPEFKRNLSVGYSGLAEVELILGNVDEALGLQILALKLCDELYTEFIDNITYKLDFAITLGEIGRCYLLKNDVVQAERHYGNYLVHMNELIQVEPLDTDFQINYAEALMCHTLTNTVYSIKQRKDNYIKSRKIFAALYKQTKNVLLREKMSHIDQILSQYN